MALDMFGNDLTVTDSWGTPRTAPPVPTGMPRKRPPGRRRLPETPLEKATAALRDLVHESMRMGTYGLPETDPAWDYAREVLREICPHPPERLHCGNALSETGTPSPWIACCDCGAVLAGAADDEPPADLHAAMDAQETAGNPNA